MSFGYTPTANTKGYYKFENNANDSSGNGNNGTWGGTETYVDGKFGQCADFNTTRYINMGNVLSFEYNVPLTRSFWIKTTESGQYKQIMNKQESVPPNKGIDIELSNGKIGCIYYSGTNTTSLCQQTTSTINDGTRKHIVVVYDGTGGRSAVKIYINAVSATLEDGPYSGFGQTVSASVVNTQGFQINGRWNSTDSTFTGQIDEVIIENTARTAQQVKDYYDSQVYRYYGEYLGAGSATTKGLYHLNGDANDSSGNGNNGTPTNVSWVDGKFGQCASFNGSSSYISTNKLGIDGGNITMSVWIKNNSEISSGGHQYISQRSNTTKNGYSLGYDYNSGTRRLFFMRNRCGVVTDVSYYTITLGTSLYYNLILTYDGTNLKGYINGVNISTLACSGNGAGTVNEGVNIGRDVEGASDYANACIDEVIIENRAWTAQEVQKYYTYSLGRRASIG